MQKKKINKSQKFAKETEMVDSLPSQLFHPVLLFLDISIKVLNQL